MFFCSTWSRIKLPFFFVPTKRLIVHNNRKAFARMKRCPAGMRWHFFAFKTIHRQPKHLTLPVTNTARSVCPDFNLVLICPAQLLWTTALFTRTKKRPNLHFSLSTVCLSVKCLTSLSADKLHTVIYGYVWTRLLNSFGVFPRNNLFGFERLLW